MRTLLDILNLKDNRGFLCLAVLAWATTGTGSARGSIINGSFEDNPSSVYVYVPGGDTTTITDWETIHTGVEWFNPQNYSWGPAQDGVRILDLNTDISAGGGIQQSITTVSGQSYSLSFYEGTLVDGNRSGFGNIIASAGSTTGTFSVFNPLGQIVWTKFSLDFVAASSTTVIKFENFDNPSESFSFLDNVSVDSAPVPEPAAAVVWGMLALLAGGVSWFQRLAK